MFSYKGSFEFDWKTLMDSLTVSPFSCGEKFYEQFDINNVCVLNVKAWFIFFDRQNHNINGFDRVWYVQCLAKRLTLNLIEFIHLKVWRSFDSLAVKNVLRNWTTTTSAARLQNPISFQNCLAVTPILDRETSFSLNWMNLIENLTVI